MLIYHIVFLGSFIPQSLGTSSFCILYFTTHQHHRLRLFLCMDGKMSSITHIQLIILHVFAAGRLPPGGLPLSECENIIEGNPK